MQLDQEHIERAAIKINKTGTIYDLPRPARHADIIYYIVEQNRKRPETRVSLTRNQTTQGFLTNTGRFVDREEAGEIAYDAGQTERRIMRLTTEDLW